MRPIRLEIHPVSALLGALSVIATLTLVGASQAPVIAAAMHRVAVSGTVGVHGQPTHPRHWLAIKEGTPFEVPEGKILIVTAIGSLSSGGSGDLSVDGEIVFKSFSQNVTQSSMEPAPPGLAISEGHSVSIQKDGSSARAWGYLVDA